jgi:hypothetical protein
MRPLRFSAVSKTARSGLGKPTNGACELRSLLAPGWGCSNCLFSPSRPRPTTQAVPPLQRFRTSIYESKRCISDHSTLGQGSSAPHGQKDDGNNHEEAQSSKGRRPAQLLHVPTKDDPSRRAIQQFNRTLKKFFSAPYSEGYNQELWRQYQTLKASNPEALRVIPHTVWKRLWRTQEARRPSDWERVTDGHRMANLQDLLNDMKSVGQQLGVEWRVLDVERQYASGQAEVALRAWESAYRRDARRKIGYGRKKEWLELGARLYYSEGNLDRVNQIISEITHRFHLLDPRFIVSTIEYYNHIGDLLSGRQAWGLYLLFRRGVQNRTDGAFLPEHYQVLDSFVQAGQKRCALGVLDDIVSASDTNLSSIRATVLGSFQSIIDSCRNVDEVNECYLLALSFLPPEMQTRDFFTQWLRTSCKFGPAEGVAQVLDLMFERGKGPEPYHFNSLLRAWFESSDQNTSQMAEGLAMQMIHKRLEVPPNRTTTPTPLVGRPISSASAETFLRLARHFALQGSTSEASDTINLLRLSNPHLTSRSNLEILRIHIQLNQYQQAWSFFKSLPSSQITLETYSVLWKGLLSLLKAHHDIIDPDIRPRLESYPNARELFTHMTSYIATNHATCWRNIDSKGITILANRAIRSFCHSRDTLGAMLAMEELETLLGVSPGPQTLDIFLTHASHDLRHLESQLSSGKANVWGSKMESYKREAEDLLKEAYRDSTASLSGKNDVKRPGDLKESNLERNGPALRELLSGFLTNILGRKFEMSTLQAKLAKARKEMGLQQREGSAFLSPDKGPFGYT